jgi:hypothetical protein
MFCYCYSLFPCHVKLHSVCAFSKIKVKDYVSLNKPRLTVATEFFAQTCDRFNVGKDLALVVSMASDSRWPGRLT